MVFLLFSDDLPGVFSTISSSSNWNDRRPCQDHGIRLFAPFVCSLILLSYHMAIAAERGMILYDFRFRNANYPVENVVLKYQ